MLDIEVVHSVAPDANIVVDFVPNTSDGFVNVITARRTTRPTRPTCFPSVGGGAEVASWSSQTITALEVAFTDAAQVGLTVTVAAGDDGSEDNDTDGSVHVDYPASSPQVLGCGGTRINVAGAAITDEVVWNDGSSGGAGGGGVSVLFPLPSWQANANVPATPARGAAGRGVPDVAAEDVPPWRRATSGVGSNTGSVIVRATRT